MAAVITTEVGVGTLRGCPAFNVTAWGVVSLLAGVRPLVRGQPLAGKYYRLSTVPDYNDDRLS